MPPGNARKPAVSVAIAYLSGALGSGVRVSDERPRTLPAELVVVRRVGGVKRNAVVDAPWLYCECWAKDDQAAEELCLRVADAMEDAPGSFVSYEDSGGVLQEAWISGHGEIGGPSSLPPDDPTVDRGRWVTTVEWLISTNV